MYPHSTYILIAARQNFNIVVGYNSSARSITFFRSVNSILFSPKSQITLPQWALQSVQDLVPSVFIPLIQVKAVCYEKGLLIRLCGGLIE